MKSGRCDPSVLEHLTTQSVWTWIGKQKASYISIYIYMYLSLSLYIYICHISNINLDSIWKIRTHDLRKYTFVLQTDLSGFLKP